jgi:hypothetical protein
MYFIFVAVDVSTSALVVAMPANMVVRKNVGGGADEGTVSCLLVGKSC